MLEIKRRPGESVSTFLHRFSKRVRESGILREAKKRRYQERPISKSKRKASAIHRAKKLKEFEKKKREGTV